MGETYREITSKNMDLLLIDELGDFHIYLHGHDVQENGVASFLSEHEIVNGFFFGPALVVDGEVQEIPENYQFDPHQKNPRAGIAQLGTLTYALVAVNGRTDQSAGVTLAEFADIMGQLGARQAYNLDGGNSATLAFNGEVYNDKPQAERSVTISSTLPAQPRGNEADGQHLFRSGADGACLRPLRKRRGARAAGRHGFAVPQAANAAGLVAVFGLPGHPAGHRVRAGAVLCVPSVRLLGNL